MKTIYISRRSTDEPLCPICGFEFDVVESNWCDHVLYVVYDGQYQFLDPWLLSRFGIESSRDFLNPFSASDMPKLGPPELIGEKLSKMVPDLIELRIEEVTDEIAVGYLEDIDR